MSGVNHLAAIIAGIVQFAFGAVWYTVFAQPWMAGIGKTEAQLMAEHGNSPLPYIVAVITAVIVAYTIAWLLPKLDARSVDGGIRVGVTLALTLIATTTALNYGFEGRPVSLWLINSGYMVVGMGIMGAIVGGWRKKKAVA
jgi:hypothetical protein